MNSSFDYNMVFYGQHGFFKFFVMSCYRLTHTKLCQIDRLIFNFTQIGL
jgi:hypothetical protein